MSTLAPGPLEACGALAGLLRCRCGMTALREHPQLKLKCMKFVGHGAAAAADRGGIGPAAPHSRRTCGFWQCP